MSGRKGGGGSASGRGGLHERVKTARRRTASSTRWLQRQLNDPYVRRAQAEGYRSGAAYKLIELDDKFGFLKKARAVVDPVSYTHLDVYKRQAFGQRPQDQEGSREEAGRKGRLIRPSTCCDKKAAGFTAVSYTHLDVYKRQV